MPGWAPAASSMVPAVLPSGMAEVSQKAYIEDLSCVMHGSELAVSVISDGVNS